MQINFDFIKQNEGKAITKAYIPENKDGSILGQSGVTIASGFDLGQQDITSISELSKDLQDKLIPYLGAKKDKAASKLKETGGLQLTDKEVNEIDMMAKQKYSNKVKESYSKLTGKSFDELPSNLQTVIADIQFQYGTNYNRTPKFAGIIQEIAENPSNVESYMKLENELRNFGDSYSTRRGKGADLIKDQIGKMQGSAPEIMDQQMKMQEMYMKAKRQASSKVAMKFNILNVMKDLGQVFQSHNKEEK